MCVGVLVRVGEGVLVRVGVGVLVRVGVGEGVRTVFVNIHKNTYLICV